MKYFVMGFFCSISPVPHADVGKDAGLVLLLEDRGVELGVQPGLGRRPLEGHRQHDAAAGVPPAGLTQVGLDVRGQGDLDVIGGVRPAIIHQNARRHRPGAHRLSARLQEENKKKHIINNYINNN